MKTWNKIVQFLAIAACAFNFLTPIVAEEFEGEEGWSVTFDGSDSLVNNVENQDDFTEKISQIQPGDFVYLNVSVSNTAGFATDWYMKNEVLNKFEKSVVASGGAYSYKLSYVDQNGNTRVIYDSDTVGGDNIVNELEGLEQATSSLTDYFYLVTLSPQESGKVMLRIGLDGETNGNSYQNAAADLELIFAVEYASSAISAEPETEIRTETKYVTVKNQKTSAVNTGDESKTMIALTGMVMALLGFVLLFVLKNRKGKK